MTVLFEKWIGERTPVYLGTNHRSQELPFSSWYRFKEAFSPELVHRAIYEHPGEVDLCIDPFSGSGTTALTSQFLGVPSTSFEVNPFLVDLSLAKTELHLPHLVTKAKDEVLSKIHCPGTTIDRPKGAWLPPTFVQPGKGGKYIFDAEIADTIFQLRYAIESLESSSCKRLLKIILGSTLVKNSNVVINGKGRRYRKNWQSRKLSRQDMLQSFTDRVDNCLSDIQAFGAKSSTETRICRADIRDELTHFPNYDLCVFSPPYPNSFDYTDVYNIELWMLGYLRSRQDNTNLRKSTLTSHVQISKPVKRLSPSPTRLSSALQKIEEVGERLWDKRIPGMLSTYFFEMNCLLSKLKAKKKPGARVWMVVGNSQYGGVEIETGQILAELAQNLGFEVVGTEICRRMRNSPQQGGSPRLGETIIVLK